MKIKLPQNLKTTFHPNENGDKLKSGCLGHFEMLRL